MTTQAASPIGLAPGVVVPPSVVGHYEITEPPSLIDRITVFSMEVLGRISDVIGVNIVAKLGESILTPKPPWFTTLGLDVAKSEYEGGDVWTITPPKPSGEVVVAVHGSGFVYPPNIIHWLDYTQMARQTGATVVVPRYPLIPDGGTAANSVPPMADFIATQAEMHGADKVSVYGDSAGGTLAMLAVHKIVRDCAGDAGCLAARVPSRLVLLSPGLAGPEIYTDPNAVLVDDPVSDIPNPEDYAGWEGDDPMLSNPTLGPTEGMPPTTVYVGSREINAPGALAYGDRLLTANPDADFHVVIGMGQIHDWAQGGGIPLNSQTGKYRDDVYRQLGIVPEGATETAVAAGGRP
ncbi:MAG: alpha/beta hydrolase [Mycobacterium sp.]